MADTGRATVWGLSVCLSVSPHDVIPENSARLQSCHWLQWRAIFSDDDTRVDHAVMAIRRDQRTVRSCSRTADTVVVKLTQYYLLIEIDP